MRKGTSFDCDFCLQKHLIFKGLWWLNAITYFYPQYKKRNANQSCEILFFSYQFGREAKNWGQNISSQAGGHRPSLAGGSVSTEGNLMLGNKRA